MLYPDPVEESVFVAFRKQSVSDPIEVKRQVSTPIMTQQELSSFIWSVADLLRGDYKQSDYGKVILPFTVLRRMDCVLEKTKAAVLQEFK